MHELIKNAEGEIYEYKRDANFYRQEQISHIYHENQERGVNYHRSRQYAEDSRYHATHSRPEAVDLYQEPNNSRTFRPVEIFLA